MSFSLAGQFGHKGWSSGVCTCSQQGRGPCMTRFCCFVGSERRGAGSKGKKGGKSGWDGEGGRKQTGGVEAAGGGRGEGR